MQELSIQFIHLARLECLCFPKEITSFKLIYKERNGIFHSTTASDSSFRKFPVVSGAMFSGISEKDEYLRRIIPVHLTFSNQIFSIFN